MKRLLTAALAGVVLAAPLATLGGPDEIQRQAIWKAHEAKRAEAAAEAQRSRAVQAHAQLMNDAKARLQADRPSADMSDQSLRAWVDGYLKRVDQSLDAMAEQYRAVTPGVGK